MRAERKYRKRIAVGAAVFAAAIAVLVLISNLAVICAAGPRIADDEELRRLDADCILILGAGVRGDRPTRMLADRLEEGLRLYREGISSKILVSGDHTREDYDEVSVMKKYLTDAGVPDEDIFMDHAGISTYDSFCRAKDVFGVKKLVVVTQEYHMYRALYICGCLGLDARGANAAGVYYPGAFFRSCREWAARDKDILFCLFRVKPRYPGEPVDIRGSGSVTNDRAG